MHGAEHALRLAAEKETAEMIAKVLQLAALPAAAALRVLEAVGEKIPVQENDRAAALERVRLRSLGATEALLDEEGGGLSDEEFAKNLRVRSRETVRKYREAGKIFAWSAGTRNLRYPAWQVHRGALLPGLTDVIAVFRKKFGEDVDPLTIVAFVLSESEELGVRPLDLLRKGNVDTVVEHARRYGQIGA